MCLEQLCLQMYPDTARMSFNRANVAGLPLKDWQISRAEEIYHTPLYFCICHTWGRKEIRRKISSAWSEHKSALTSILSFIEFLFISQYSDVTGQNWVRSVLSYVDNSIVTVLITEIADVCVCGTMSAGRGGHNRQPGYPFSVRWRRRRRVGSRNHSRKHRTLIFRWEGWNEIVRRSVSVTARGDLVSCQFGERRVHLVGQRLISVLIDAQFIWNEEGDDFFFIFVASLVHCPIRNVYYMQVRAHSKLTLEPVNLLLKLLDGLLGELGARFGLLQFDRQSFQLALEFLDSLIRLEIFLA